MLVVHDTVAQKNFDPVLPPLPDNIDEDFDEESVKIVRLVKNKEPLVCDTHLSFPVPSLYHCPTHPGNGDKKPPPEVPGVSDISFVRAATGPRGTFVCRVPLSLGYTASLDCGRAPLCSK